jgi:hypothetical protein
MVEFPVIWWKSMLRFPSNQEFAEFARKCISVSASSASVKRNFSLQSRIHSKDRNKLTPKRFKELLAIKYNGNLLEATNLIIMPKEIEVPNHSESSEETDEEEVQFVNYDPNPY